MASNSILSAKPGLPCSFPTPRPLHLLPKKRQYASCKATGGPVDRRDVLIGLGGAVAGLSAYQSALADPIQEDLHKCSPPDTTGLRDVFINCCPPYGTNIVDFEPLPLWPLRSPTRCRQPAHQAQKDSDYVKKYKLAYQLMKELPVDDPRSLEQQWRVHCAYCDGAYQQVGVPDQKIQLHHSWLFFPWHRLFLFFHERILGKLISDPNFALPFWNWDYPDGMTLPEMYSKDKDSPLYNPRRNAAHQCHQPPVYVDLDYNGKDPKRSRTEQIEHNLKIMYRQMVRGAKTTKCFMGWPYIAGSGRPSPGAGTIEIMPHDTVHSWTGDPGQPNSEDMGTYYSAGRDPVFYAHHANVDRLWNVWRGLSSSNKNFDDPDWLNATFLFYDEEARLTRVKVCDCLDTDLLGYTYEDVDSLWKNSKLTPLPPPVNLTAVPPPPPATSVFPTTLDKVVRVRVARPTPPEGEEEEMVIGVEIANQREFVKFDVYVNEPGLPHGDLNTTATECAGSFVRLPHPHSGGITTTASFAIGELLREKDTEIVVTLVPISGGANVTITGINIQLCE